jgi:hypothetical protein
MAAPENKQHTAKEDEHQANTKSGKSAPAIQGNIALSKNQILQVNDIIQKNAEKNQ